MSSQDSASSEETRSVLERYERELYDARDINLTPELLADPMYRHDAGGETTAMTNADCAARIGGFFEQFSLLTFRTVHLVVEGEIASWTYQPTLQASDGAETVISSIETFEVQNGKITQVWNAEHKPGPWA